MTRALRYLESVDPTPGKATGAAVVSALIDHAEAGEYMGACRVCGAIREGCEPDATRYRCDDCGRYAVDGFERWLLDPRLRGES